LLATGIIGGVATFSVAEKAVTPRCQTRRRHYDFGDEEEALLPRDAA